MLKSKLMDNWLKVAHVLVAGGCAKAKEREVHNSVELLTLKVNNESGECRITTEYFASLNEPRRGAVLRKLAVGINKSYNYLIIGGCSSETNHSNTMEILDKKKNSWTLVPNALAQGRSCFVVTSGQPDFDDVLYCCGGWNGVECMRSIDEIEINKSHVFDDDESKKSRPTTTTTSNDIVVPLKNSCCVDVPAKRRSFVIGGWDGKRTLDAIYNFHPAADDPYDKLQYVARLPYPVECHACALWRNKKIFVVGGFDGLIVRDDIIVIDVDTLDVRQLSSACKLEKRRENLCVEIVNDYLIVVGGWDGYGALRSVELFKIVEDRNNGVKIESLLCDHNLLDIARNRACSIVLDE